MKKYSIKRESIIKEISEEAKTGNSLIGKLGLGGLKRTITRRKNNTVK